MHKIVIKIGQKWKHVNDPNITLTISKIDEERGIAYCENNKRVFCHLDENGYPNFIYPNDFQFIDALDAPLINQE